MHVRKIHKDGGSSSFSDREGSFLVTRHETTLSEFGWRSAVCQIGPSRSREIHGMSKREKERAKLRTNEETVREDATKRKKPPSGHKLESQRRNRRCARAR